MKHLLSILLVAVTLIGTSSFTYETTSTTNTESISIQKQKKHSGRKTHKRSKTRKYRTRKNRSTRSASIGQTVYITPQVLVTIPHHHVRHYGVGTIPVYL